MTQKEKRNAAKIKIGIYMCVYYTLVTNKESTMVGTKSEIKARLKNHGGLKNSVIVQQWDGKSWTNVLSNCSVNPVNTLFTEKDLWDINTKNMNFDHLEDFFGGTLPLPGLEKEKAVDAEPEVASKKTCCRAPAVVRSTRSKNQTREQKMSNKKTCPLCNKEAKLTDDSHRSIFEILQCQTCRLKFSFFGEKLEWVPAEFEVGKTYCANVSNRDGTVHLEFEIKKNDVTSITARINGLSEHTFALYICHETEVLRVGSDLVGTAFDLFPYDVKTEEVFEPESEVTDEY